ncbi:MAG: hypothetical protein QM489_03780 [Candidatus Izemoplasma sp.]
MKELNLLKYKHDNQTGILQYFNYHDNTVALSEIKSLKVLYIEEYGKLDVTFDVDSDVFETLNVSIITDKEYISNIYHFAIDNHHAYFKDGYDNLYVIKFDK